MRAIILAGLIGLSALPVRAQGLESPVPNASFLLCVGGAEPPILLAWRSQAGGSIAFGVWRDAEITVDRGILRAWNEDLQTTLEIMIATKVGTVLTRARAIPVVCNEIRDQVVAAITDLVDG